MDIKHKDHLKPGARVAVFMGEIAAEVMGHPPFVTTATVAEGVDGNHHVWLLVDIAQDQTLPQRYKVEEIIGFLMPMAIVERSADGQTTYGRIPEGYVGP